MKQLHKRFSDEQVKELIERYEKKKIKRVYIEQILQINKTRFFELVKKYRKNKKVFNIGYKRGKATRKIDKKIEKHIVEELKKDKKLIEDKETPIKKYNYSYVQNRLKEEYGEKVSLYTIIDRAKKEGYYKGRERSKKHDREVVTNYTGELIQHDSSHHLFAPDAGKKWYLITSIDDYSRYMLYAKFVEVETSITHIKALEEVFVRYGFPMKYYVDSHRIFRFVQGRDSIWRKHYLQTDDVDTQWEKVLEECKVGKEPALSPQAKGKVERPYQWVQDHIVRTSAREGIKNIKEGSELLKEEIKAYNFKRVHSTTGEIPYYRFKRALKENSLWRSFEIPKPYESVKDIFTVKLERRADGYRRISIDRKELKVNGLNPYEKVEVRIYKLNEEMCELRFWRNKQLLDKQRLKNKDLRSVRF